MIAAALAAALSTTTVFQTPGLVRPQDALWDPGARALYVSCLGGPETGGWVAKLSPDGRLAVPRWAAGLGSPKGLALSRGLLYAADGGGVDVMDAASGRVVRRVPVPGASDLTGACAAKDGSVYLSDPERNAVFRLSPDGGSVEAAAGDWLEHPAGLACRGRALFVAARGTKAVPGRVYRLDPAAKRRLDVSPVPLGRLRGLTPGRTWDWGLSFGRTWLVTGEDGSVWSVAERGGTATLLLSGLPGPGGPAFDPRRRLLVLPLAGQDLAAGWDARGAR